MNYRSREFLQAHIKSILDFYHPAIVDPAGGYFQNFLDDGSVFDADERHLVSSTRMVFNFCKAYELFGDEEYRRRAEHGLAFVAKHHWDQTRGGYDWTLKGDQATDQTNYCYGLAFVMLMYASAFKAKVVDAPTAIDETFEILESRFWLDDDGLYADEASADWSNLSDYRGQNANMHTCEAMLAAFEATASERYLERAYDLAQKFAVELARKSE